MNATNSKKNGSRGYAYLALLNHQLEEHVGSKDIDPLVVLLIMPTYALDKI